jgi:hypothetical protein
MAMDRELKSISYLLAAMGVLMGVTLISSYKEDTAKTAMAAAFSTAAKDTTYRLEGAHAVTTEYEGRKYTYNFDNKTILAGQTEHVGFGGGGYGGLQSFDNFKDQAAITTARTQGCAVAAQAAKAENPGWPVTTEFSDAQAKAARFAKQYCP